SSLSWPEWLEYGGVYIATALLVRLVMSRVEGQIQQADQLRLAETQRGQALALLAESARQMTGLSDPEAVMTEAARRLVDVFHFDHAAVLLVEDDQLAVHASRGTFSAARPPGARLPLSEDGMGRAGRLGVTVFQPTATDGPVLGGLARFPVG